VFLYCLRPDTADLFWLLNGKVMPLFIVPLEIVEGIISIRLTGFARLLSEIVLAVPFE
jgi:hypothetical protein